MKHYRRHIITLLVALTAVLIGTAATVHDDDDDKTGGQPFGREVRRLHPERERARAFKKLQEQRSRKAEAKDDPWDTSGDVWGTVDVMPLTPLDSTAAQGYRLTGDQPGGIIATRRMTWRDEPVTATLDQLLPAFIATDEGEYRSRYVSTDNTSNEVYFAITMEDGDSVPSALRLCVQYCGTTAIGYDQVIFTIDGFDYPFYPTEPRQGTLDGGLRWERSDDVLKPVHRDLAYALAHSHWVAMKLTGPRGIQRVKMLTDGQRDDFALTLELFRLLGGSL